MERHVLDRPIWSALTTRQAGLAIGSETARRFPRDISPFIAIGEDIPERLQEVADLVSPGEGVAFMQVGPVPLPPGFEVRKAASGIQLVSVLDVSGPDLPEHCHVLGDDDAEEMRALARLTEPGPFEARTHTLGRFWGLRENGRLVAMAGERLAVPGYTEVSGVCTHPDVRGRGLAAALSAQVARHIRARGETPFLHSYASNETAIRIYEALGFRKRVRVNVAFMERV